MFTLIIQAPDPKLDELDKSFEREVRLERKLRSLSIIFWVFAGLFLAAIIIVLTLKDAPGFWTILVSLFCSIVLFRLLFHWMNRIEGQIAAECIIQKNLRCPGGEPSKAFIVSDSQSNIKPFL